ncbi:hypothetical protein OB2597_19631 [Pseudooceanicola batsensis HTCC2597]|uniref:Uncharacterized protein n=1 Tax=Pseudooceanicola batsensis (strain ATCC BAA-863 / DSM 15984 / KCTC 12145 / HTCC2597) TaxID=252305 RepID=A3U0N6_PSEBH|nr:efflux RND transporter periplasmic adaptor subunit [Pseudooceanicola batsensis]EAQ02327.1 hypothetical protein OB2597_19631 [Pseudooceanicola batsensis HTCC2597]
MTETPKDPPKPDWALTNRERKARTARAEGGKPPRRRWPWVVLGLALLAAAGAYGLRQGLIELPAQEMAATPDPEDQPPAPEAAPDTVMQLLPRELTEVERMTLQDTVRITGSLSPANHLGIPAEVSGRVDEVLKRPGDAADEGEVLVRIDIETLRNQLEQSRATADATRAQLEFARSQLERTESLVDRGIAASSTLDSNVANVQQLQSNLAALERQVATAEQALDKATITAPFSGMISQRNVDPGTYVAPGTALMTLVDITSLELEGAVPVLYAPRIRTGQTVTITVEGLGAQSFSGTVERIAPVAATGTRMLPIYATFGNDDGTLRGGMFASGRLVLGEKADAIGIPRDALREDDEGRFVLRIEGDRVERQPVTVARMWDRGRMVEISEGLDPGDTIVSAPLERLHDGMQIAVVGG